jgi:uncharacterized membrane protein YqaE (UPF0057 family)
MYDIHCDILNYKYNCSPLKCKKIIINHLSKLPIEIDDLQIYINNKLFHFKKIELFEKYLTFNTRYINSIKLYPKLKGGIFGGLGDALSGFGDFFKDVGEFFKGVGEFLSLVMKILKFLILFISWLFEFIWWLFKEFLNPLTLINDFTKTIFTLCQLFFDIFKDMFAAISRTIFNNVFNITFSSFFGWDAPTETEEGDGIDEDGNNKKCSEDGIKCYRNDDGSIPLSVLVATIILPPLGIFMEFGLSNFTNIVICCVLTLLFYFPGLIYAFIMIYN